MPASIPANRPFVTANFALSWDGRVSTRKLTPSDFSSPADKQRLLEIRAAADAILVGARTVATDTMTMGLPVETLREERVARGQSAYPIRILLTNSGRLNPQLRVFGADFSPIHIFSTTRMPAKTREALGAKATLHLEPGPHVDIRAMLGLMRTELGIRTLHCEGGPTVLRALLEADLVDVFYLTLCPRIFGGLRAPTLTGVADSFLPKSTQLQLEDFEVLGEECYLRYCVQRASAG
jgi:5-amino-6-(5-phosphoribosylamino)uracil reductase